MSEGVDCRLDVWLWRARFFKTRALASRFLEAGRLRVTRPGSDPVRIDKPSRTIRPGDRIVFALGGRVIEVEVKAVGKRRGPASEARELYCEPLEQDDLRRNCLKLESCSKSKI